LTALLTTLVALDTNDFAILDTPLIIPWIMFLPAETADERIESQADTSRERKVLTVLTTRPGRWWKELTAVVMMFGDVLVIVVLSWFKADTALDRGFGICVMTCAGNWRKKLSIALFGVDVTVRILLMTVVQIDLVRSHRLLTICCNVSLAF